mmetsp:Transcript_10094/g.33611  ORF Transcript_10094/g.33611 Transcript_10094/m.33611 type:complete len:180 (+) Transcript_10094:976-1515(+)
MSLHLSDVLLHCKSSTDRQERKPEHKCFSSEDITLWPSTIKVKADGLFHLKAFKKQSKNRINDLRCALLVLVLHAFVFPDGLRNCQLSQASKNIIKRPHKSSLCYPTDPLACVLSRSLLDALSGTNSVPAITFKHMFLVLAMDKPYIKLNIYKLDCLCNASPASFFISSLQFHGTWFGA